jgi:hypothetical protein
MYLANKKATTFKKIPTLIIREKKKKLPITTTTKELD